MDILRARHSVDPATALAHVTFCLDQLEKIRCRYEGAFFAQKIGPRLTYEEVIGALVEAEPHLREWLTALEEADDAQD